MKLTTCLRKGYFALGPIELRWEPRRRHINASSDARATLASERPYAIHIRPGPLRKKTG